MPFHWKKDIREQPANTIMLLEDIHFHCLAQQAPWKDLAYVLKTHAHIAWYISHKTPELRSWVEKLLQTVADEPEPDDMDRIIGDVMETIEDWIIYVTTPEDYHRQSFVDWDERELTERTEYSGKTVVDIGSGTGKQAFAVAPLAKAVYCIEPVWNLRRYLKQRVEREGYRNVYVVDGQIESIPFVSEFSDVTISGHVVGDELLREAREMERITAPGGMMVLCPGNDDADNETHRQLIDLGYGWSRFLEPGEDVGSGYKRKYWKTKD